MKKKETKELNEVEKKVRNELTSYGMASIIFGITALIMSLLIYRLPNYIVWLVHPCIATAIILGCMDMNGKVKLFAVEGIALGMFSILINSRAYMLALIALFIIAKNYIIQSLVIAILIGVTIKIIEKSLKNMKNQFLRITIVVISVFGIWALIYFGIFGMLR